MHALSRIQPTRSCPVALAIIKIVLDLLTHIADLGIVFALSLRDRVARQRAADVLDRPDYFLAQARDLVGEAVFVFLFFFVHVSARPYFRRFSRSCQKGRGGLRTSGEELGVRPGEIDRELLA